MARQLVNEPTDVEAHFDVDGRVQVRSFTWKGRRWPAVSQGRQWMDEAGQRHILVMTVRERVYELAYAAATSQWRVVMASEDRLAA